MGADEKLYMLSGPGWATAAHATYEAAAAEAVALAAEADRKAFLAALSEPQGVPSGERIIEGRVGEWRGFTLVETE